MEENNIDLSNFSNRLTDLMDDRHINAKQLSESAGVKLKSIYRLLLKDNKYYPDLENALRLADCLKCSADYLVGLEPENYNPDPKTDRPSFASAFLDFFSGLNITKDAFCKLINLHSTSSIYEWLNGKKLPRLNTLIKISLTFHTPIDAILKR